MNDKERLAAFFTSHPKETFKTGDVMKALELDRSRRRQVKKSLDELETEGKIHRYKGGRWGQFQLSNVLTGTVSIARKGYGFLRPDPVAGPSENSVAPPDVFLPQKDLGGAMNGDRVSVRVTRREEQDGPRLAGRVIQIIKRSRTELAGRFSFLKKGGSVIPRDQRINRQVIIPHVRQRDKLKNGSWVMVKILDHGDERHPMLGEITEVLGSDKDRGIDVFVIIRDYGVPTDFSGEVLQEALAAPSSLTHSDLKGRKDLRDKTIFTIDPKTAKDFDDALSVERLPEGGFRLGVHIADVAHYVKPGSAVDREARSRSTSIYPVDRVVPMLPEHLSNNMCSLRPREDRLTMSVFMDIDNRGRIHHAEFHNSVIHSRFRMTYEEVQAFFDGSDQAVTDRYASIQQDLEALKELAGILIRMRHREGAMDLDVGEAEVVFNEDGVVVDLVRRPRLFSHRVVEQAMILANEAVASKIARHHVPTLYRIHEQPSQEKLRALIPVLVHFGLHLPPQSHITPAHLQNVLGKTEGMGEVGPILRRVVLRAMMKACYSPDNLGHYGLGSRCYCHFTSPIRRYPDLIVHRTLKMILKGEHRDAEAVKEWGQPLASLGEYCSGQERVSADIEYESTALKGMEFMWRFLGQEFDGIICSITNFGFFVELIDYPIEGLVPVNSIGGEFWDFDEAGLRLIGRTTGRAFRLGDQVRVSIETIDIPNRRMELTLVR